MKFNLFLLFSLFIFSCGQLRAQMPAVPATSVYTVVEQMPQFPGGMDALVKHVIKRMKPIGNHSITKVYFTFIVGSTGEVSDVSVMKMDGLSLSEKEETLKEELIHLVFADMPRWIPGRQGGKVVNVRYVLPISCILYKD